MAFEHIMIVRCNAHSHFKLRVYFVKNSLFPAGITGGSQFETIIG
jgi:hypothetical protein